MSQGLVIKIKMVPVQTPVGTLLGLGTQPCNKAPDDLQVENVKLSD